MKTSPECLPCLLRQASYAAGLCTDDPALQQRITRQAERLISSMSMTPSPPENAIALYEMIADLGGCPDPFARQKQDANALTLRLKPQLQKIVRAGADPLATSIRFATAGNIIDYGSHQDFDAEVCIAGCLERPFAIDSYRELADDLAKAESVLYLADNCGELILDSLVIEILEDRGKRVVLAVKERPIINDATMSEALGCGLDKICEVISNGTACPGTVLSRCSDRFREVFESADCIISKGQGNFETLCDTEAPLYFLLTVKCAVVGRMLATFTVDRKSLHGKGEMVLLKQTKTVS